LARVAEGEKSERKELREEAYKHEVEIRKRIYDVKNVKVKLAAEVAELIEGGRRLLGSEDKTEAQITEFLTSFQGKISELKRKESYETELEKTVEGEQYQVEEKLDYLDKDGKEIIKIRTRNK